MAARKKQVKYDNESISSLKGADRVRKRPGVIFGSDGIEGCQHSAFEIISNSIDEAREGFGNVINITLFSDHSIEVEDFGRGVPVDFNQNEQRYNWELVFCELYAGGKYNNEEGENYEFSLGLNGLGSCATQYSSEYMDVTVYRDGFKHSLRFEKGENVGGLSKEEFSGKRTGTIIKWKPDLEVFTDISISPDYFRDILKRQAVVNAGLKFNFKYQQGNAFETESFLYESGIEGYVEEIANGEQFTQIQMYQGERRGRDRADKPEYKVLMSAALAFCNTVNLIEYYHNSSYLEYGGAPDKAVKSAFTSAIDAYIKQAGKYKANESKITFNDIAESLILVTNCFSTRTSYENQTKKAITNVFVQKAMTEFFKEKLEIYFIENKQEADKIADQILINKRSREDAEKTRLNLKKKLTGGNDITTRVQKFVDCRSRDVNARELYIVEGDSALGSCVQGRDAEFQAVIPVRGKILNCLKSDLNKIFQNEIITDLIKVLGCGVEVKGKNRDMKFFDFDALRWSKIIICTDADVDGFQIRTLILTMLYRLTPTLIERGKVYIAESPLYEITSGGKSYFAYNDYEKTEIMQSLDGKKYTVMRSKGLGENEPDMMWQTTMNPESRRLIKVQADEAKKTNEYFELLLGNNLNGRKDFIAENGHKYLELADIS